jgi:hypothetical protein
MIIIIYIILLIPNIYIVFKKIGLYQVNLFAIGWISAFFFDYLMDLTNSLN